MSKNAHNVSNRLGHYRLVTVLAAMEAACPPQRLDVSNGGGRVHLASVAKVMQVPVAIATYRDQSGLQTFAAHGFSDATSVGPFAAACNNLCSERTLAVPDIALHVTLSGFVNVLPKADIRFLVGMALLDKRGQRVGSLTVMNSSKAVARQGISFRMLIALGKAFAETGRLHAELIEADIEHPRALRA